jgi:glutathione S-transferase
MTLTLYAHPFSSYGQKVLVALYENDTAFAFRRLGPDEAEAVAEWAKLWPIRRFPVLLDDGRTIAEASIIIEHLDLHHPARSASCLRIPQPPLRCASWTGSSTTTS